MKARDVIRMPKGTRSESMLQSEFPIIVRRIQRVDNNPYDFEVLADCFIHAMGFQLQDNTEVASESR